MSIPYTLEQIEDIFIAIVSSESNRRRWLPVPLRTAVIPGCRTKWSVFCGWDVYYEIDLQSVEMNSHRGLSEVCGMINELLKPFFAELDVWLDRPVKTKREAS